MSTQKKIIKSGYVHLFNDGVVVTLGPGDAVPDWADVTNPALFEDDEPDTAETTEAVTVATTVAVQSPDTAPASPEPTVKELREQAKALGLSAGGSKAELAARIAEKQAESAPAAGESDEESDRAALEVRANEAGVEFDENTTDDELVALLED